MLLWVFLLEARVLFLLTDSFNGSHYYISSCYTYIRGDLMLTNIKAAIFDLDGTLIDSMWVWGKIDEDYFRNRNMDLPQI